jgi:hypothetical protein
VQWNSEPAVNGHDKNYGSHASIDLNVQLFSALVGVSLSDQSQVKFTGLGQTLGQLSQPLIGILSQTAGSTGKLWVNPVSFTFLRTARGKSAF